MAEEINFLYESYQLYYKSGLNNLKQGKTELGVRNLKLAGEALLKIAKNSQGQLKKVRFEKAKEILLIAETPSLYTASERKPPSQSTQSSTNKQKSDGPGKAGEADSETVWENVEAPTIGFDDIAGLDEAKNAISMRIILPLKNEEIFKAYNKRMGGGVLLYGLPGTGKTMIAKATAKEAGAEFYSVKCSDIVSKWFGEAERNVKNLFDTARQNQRAIIFFDEFEAISPKRGSGSNVMDRLVPELLAQINGFNTDGCKLLLLGATNRPWDIDSAMLRPERMSQLIYIPLPDDKAREFLIKKAIKNVPLESDITVNILVDLTKGFNGADVCEFCDRMKESAIMRTINSSDKMLHKVTLSDVYQTAKCVHSTVQKADIEQMSGFMENNNKI